MNDAEKEILRRLDAGEECVAVFGVGITILFDNGMVRDMARDCGCLAKLEGMRVVGPTNGFFLERFNGGWALFVRFAGYPAAKDNGFMAAVGGAGDKERLGSMARDIARRTALPVWDN
ncbi:MAG: hypothetical protein LBC18_14280 [Opitutaceae bacterium]|nr:hypothetical protein [Opitutaceae bacterium]